MSKAKAARHNPPEAKDGNRLTRKQAERHIEQLGREIGRHDYLYYVKNKPEISDEAYDRPFEKLKRLEERFPDLVTSDSPTQRVGGQPREELQIAKHTAPMLSLDATREASEVRRFDQRIQRTPAGKARYLVEDKLDGVSAEVVYRRGLLEWAVTRGDGQEGEEVTENVKSIRAVALRLCGAKQSAPPS